MSGLLDIGAHVRKDKRVRIDKHVAYTSKNTGFQTWASRAALIVVKK